MRYPLAPLERLVAVSLNPEIGRNGQTVARSDRAVADALGIDRRQLLRWRESGVDFDRAERLAGRAGFVVYEVWPEWLEESFVTCQARGCEVRFAPSRKGHRYCSTNCQGRERVRRKYHADEAQREAKKAARRAYYAEATEYERRQARRRYHANVELSRERKRAQRAARSATRCDHDDRESMVA